MEDPILPSRLRIPPQKQAGALISVGGSGTSSEILLSAHTFFFFDSLIEIEFTFHWGEFNDLGYIHSILETSPQSI